MKRQADLSPAEGEGENRRQNFQGKRDLEQRRLPSTRCFSKQRSLLLALCSSMFLNFECYLCAERLLQVISCQVPLVLKIPCGDWAGAPIGVTRKWFSTHLSWRLTSCSCFVASPFLPHSVPQLLAIAPLLGPQSHG